VILVIVVAYSEIVFEGKTLMMHDRVQGVSGRACVSQSDIDHGSEQASLGFARCLTSEQVRNDPRGDPGAGAWALTPWARTVHRALADGEPPIWNRYEGIGAPLAANMQSAAFDPLLLPYHLDPRAGVHDLSMLVALLLIGCATYLFARVVGLAPVSSSVAASVFALSGWFFAYNNNDWFRVYLYLPILLACIEWCSRSRAWSSFAILGVAIAGTIAVGMPEPTFVALTSASLYALLRLWFGPRVWPRAKCALRLAAGAAVGLMLSAPLLLLFAEYVPRSVNSHDQLPSLRPLTDPAGAMLNWIVPTISPASIGNPFAGTRNWIGAGACALVVVAFVSPDLVKKHRGWLLTVIGAAVGLRIYGGDLVEWTRHIPLVNVVLWPVFATPVIAFAAAILAGIGVEALRRGQIPRARLGLGAAVAVVLFALLAITAGPDLDLGLGDFDLSGGWGLAAITFLGLMLLVAFAPRRVAVPVVCALVLVELVMLAPRGIYADRADPFPQTDWIRLVRGRTAQNQARVFSPRGVLFPDTSSAYGLQDPRVLDAVYIERYWRYLRRFISPSIVDRYTAIESSHGPQTFENNRMFDLLGVRYMVAGHRTKTPAHYRLVYSSARKRVFENERAIPRAFVVHRVSTVDDEARAIAALSKGEPRREDGRVDVTRKDPAREAVVEARTRDISKLHACRRPDASSARFVAASSTEITIKVDTPCAGLLVFTDAYYPGWHASVNGAYVKILPTDVAFRGVFVPRGASIVRFRYSPGGFRLGLLLTGLGLIVVGVAVCVDLRRAVRSRRAAAGDAPGSGVGGPATVPRETGKPHEVTRDSATQHCRSAHDSARRLELP
jgi:hypothetical protein